MKRFASVVVVTGLAVMGAVVAMTRVGVAQEGPMSPVPAAIPQPPALNSGTVVIHLRKDVLHAVSSVEWLRGNIVQMNNEWVVLRGDFGEIGEGSGMFAGKSNVWIPRAHVLMIAQETR